MTKTEEHVVCDCCGREITIPTTFLNDGSFQYSHINLHGKDICNMCALEFLSKLDNEIGIDESTVETVVSKMGSLTRQHTRSIDWGDLINV